MSFASLTLKGTFLQRQLEIKSIVFVFLSRTNKLYDILIRAKALSVPLHAILLVAKLLCLPNPVQILQSDMALSFMVTWAHNVDQGSCGDGTLFKSSQASNPIVTHETRLIVFPSTVKFFQKGRNGESKDKGHNGQ